MKIVAPDPGSCARERREQREIRSFRTLAGAPEKAQRPSNGQEPAGDNFAHDGSIQAAGTRAADAGPTDRMCFEVASATTSSEKPRRRCAALRWPGRTAHTVEQKRGVH